MTKERKKDAWFVDGLQKEMEKKKSKPGEERGVGVGVGVGGEISETECRWRSWPGVGPWQRVGTL